MRFIPNWGQQLQHGTDQQQDRTGDARFPRIPGWIAEWGWAVLGVAAYVALVVIVTVVQVSVSIVVRLLVIALVSTVAALLWYRIYRGRAVYEAQRDQAIREELARAHIDRMTWQAFEDHCVRVLEGLGYREVKKTRDVSREKAVDITAIAPDGTAVAVECKHFSSSVGVPVIRGIIGAVTTGMYKGRAAMLMTSAAVTKEAREIAAEGRVEVIDRSRLMEWTVEAMRQIQTRAQKRLPQPPSSSTGRHRVMAVAVADRIRSMSQPGKVTAAIVCCSVVTASIVAVLAAAGPRPGGVVPAADSRPGLPASQVAGATRSLPASAAPATVVRDFFTAISRQDWAKVWLLGGKNLGHGPYRSYRGMISGYAGTVRDLLVTLNVTGDTASGEFIAYETEGREQFYQYSYVVRGGTIVSGYQRPRPG
jgi:restriction system protein